MLVVKYLFSQRQLNDTYSGGVGSFMLTLMALHVVQQVLVCARGGCVRVAAGGWAPEPVCAAFVSV